MKHAFLLMVHDDPELLARILNRLKAPNHFFFLNIDGKTGNEYIPRFLTLLDGGKDLPVKIYRKRLNWGGYSIVDCELFLMREATKADISFDYFHLLSGHDYPCVNNLEFDRFFEENKGRSFMHFDSDEEVAAWRKRKYPDRVMPWYLFDQMKGGRLRRYCEKMLNKVAKRKPIPELYAGWQWFSWHKSLVKYVLDYEKENSAFFRRFHFTKCSDEVVFHTLLHSHIDELNIVPHNSLRFIEWHPKRSFKTLPLVLEKTELEGIIEQKSLFCRKVRYPESETLLDALDKLSLN